MIKNGKIETPKTLTAKKAITIGQWLVNIPIILITFGATFGTLYYTEQVGISGAWTFVAFFGGLLISWLYWSIAGAKWLAWAYQNVANKKELRYRSELGNILWKQDSFFNKTMLLSAKDRKIIEIVEKNMMKNDKIETPEERTLSVYFSPLEFWFTAFFVVFFCGMGIVLTVLGFQSGEPKSFFLGIGFALVFGFGLFKDVPFIDLKGLIPYAKRYFKKEPQIEILPQGISIRAKRTGLIPWYKINYYHIDFDDKGYATQLDLGYWEEKETEEEIQLEISLGSLSVDGVTLEQFLTYYT